MRNLGDDLRRLRRLRGPHLARGSSQRAFAQRAGIGQNMVARAEKGEDIRLSTLEKLAAAGEAEILLIPREIAPAVHALLRAFFAGRSLDEEMDKPMYTLDEEEDLP